jgi:hypothetical protein
MRYLNPMSFPIIVNLHEASLATKALKATQKAKTCLHTAHEKTF